MLNLAYTTLMNEEKRRIYDETGSIEGLENEIDSASFDMAYTFYRAMYKAVTKEDIECFEKRYRGSQEEIEDIVSFYEEFEGDVKHILEWIPLSRNEDIQRFIEIIEKLIAEGETKKYPKFDKTKTKIKLLPENEKEEAENFEDLKQKIVAKKQDSGNDFLEKLAKKYGKKEEEYEDIDDEEFERIQKEMKEKSKGTKKKKH